MRGNGGEDVARWNQLEERERPLPFFIFCGRSLRRLVIGHRGAHHEHIAVSEMLMNGVDAFRRSSTIANECAPLRAAGKLTGPEIKRDLVLRFRAPPPRSRIPSCPTSDC